MPGPAATVGSMHTCPMCSGTIPHVGGPVTGPGSPNVFINGKPAAVMGDMCTCVGGPDTIAQGEATVLINGVPAATVGCMTAHGGTITVGEPNVLIGTGGSGPKAVAPINRIPFPEIRIVDRIGALFKGESENLKKAEANQEALKQEAENNEGEPKVYNLQWRNEETTIRERKVLKLVTLTADVMNIPDGQTATIKVSKPVENAEEEIIELTGTVQDKRVTVEWEIEDASDLSD